MLSTLARIGGAVRPYALAAGLLVLPLAPLRGLGFVAMLALSGPGCAQEPAAPTGSTSEVLGAADPVALSPNGTAPTRLVDVSVVAVNSTQMRVSGRYVKVSGGGIAGMPIRVYSASTYFSHWATIYTDNNGYFTQTMSKVPAGTSVQIEAAGNGAYSRPFPTFARP
ncbi:MAG: hypothetical protein IT349_09055 [Candidatus Eisenbacteria bacterium]|nr:hypothetical protein [Candidatus Eisenbacteria bacterium]